MRVSVWLARGSIETAELTVGVTDIGWIEMPVDVEVRDFAVSFSSDCVCEFSEAGQIIRSKERDAIRLTQ